MMNNIRQTDNYKSQMGIYIHIPFCVKKCEYCDFLSSCEDATVRSSYTDALISEINSSVAGTTMNGEAVVTSIFFGGGTPSILEAAQTVRIMEAVKNRFNISSDAEITIECNPGTVTPEKLKAYRESGINRISFGLQSADNVELREIGRIHTFEQFLDSFNMARNAGFNNINVDLISALPGQTVVSWKNTLGRVLLLGPEHISAYSLILEEGTSLYNRIEEERKNGIDRIPDEESEREMYRITEEFLQKAGYVHYEISNYSKPGFECRHNLLYWAPDDYLGFGIGAASYINGTRYKNTDDINEYIACTGTVLSAGTSSSAGTDGRPFEKIRTEVTELTKENMMEEFMFLGLRRIDGVSTEEFKRRFDVEFETIYGDTAGEQIEKGLLKKDGDRILLTEKGLDVCNMVMAEFLFD